MKNLTNLLMIFCLYSCNFANKQNQIIGTWELVSAVTIEGDSSFSTFNPNNRMIKMINPTHFSFVSHDIFGGKDSTKASFTAGAGRYTLVDSTYTEHLEYFNNREWENNSFKFTLKIENDSLIQRGVEKIEKLGIDHIIIEKYKKIK